MPWYEMHEDYRHYPISQCSSTTVGRKWYSVVYICFSFESMLYIIKTLDLWCDASVSTPESTLGLVNKNCRAL